MSTGEPQALGLCFRTVKEVRLASLCVSLSLPYSQIFQTILIQKGQKRAGDFIVYGKGKGKQDIYSMYFPVPFSLNLSEFAQLVRTKNLL